MFCKFRKFMLTMFQDKGHTELVFFAFNKTLGRSVMKVPSTTGE